MSYAICEQQRRRSACASAQSDQPLCCSLLRQNDTSSLYIWNIKILAGRCSWAGQFVSCLVGDSRRHIFYGVAQFNETVCSISDLVTKFGSLLTVMLSSIARLSGTSLHVKTQYLEGAKDQIFEKPNSPMAHQFKDVIVQGPNIWRAQ